MQPIVIEGTWEEIERRKAELIGRQLRVMVLPKTVAKPVRNAEKATPMPDRAKELKGFGMLAGVLSTEDYLREKQEEIKLEERHSR